MFFGTRRVSSVTHAAGSPLGGTSASPYTLVVLVFVLGGTYLMFVSEPILNKVAGGAAMI